MRLDIDRYNLKIVSDGSYFEDIETAYIEEVLGLKKDGDCIILKRKNASGLSCIAYLETEKIETEKTVKSAEQNHSQMICNVKGIEFRLNSISAGTFIMGSPNGERGRDEDERQHKVTLTNGFLMMEHQVTQEIWEIVMGKNPSKFKGARRPVEGVSWNDCQEFIRKINALTGKQFRLPTEAQWEYACRAGTKSALYNGKELTSEVGSCPNLDEIAWYTENSGSETKSVKQKKPNNWGLYDMLGNIWEWCQDWYGDYPDEYVTDPEGVSSGDYRVIRGGGWLNYAGYCRAALRNRNDPDDRYINLGFRLVHP